MFIWGALRDLVPCAQFKKREKHLWKSLTFSTKSNTPPWMFFTFFKFTNGTKSRTAPHIALYHCWPGSSFHWDNMHNPKGKKNFTVAIKHQIKSYHWSFHTTGLFLYPLKTDFLMFSVGIERDHWHEWFNFQNISIVPNSSVLDALLVP